MKTCSKCSEEKQATTEYFCKDKAGKNGLHASCKECQKEYQLKYRKEHKDESKKHRDEVAIYNKQYYLKNKEKIIVANKNYREDHKDKIRENKKVYHFNNKEHCNAKSKEWALNNKEKIIYNRKKYYENNKEIMLEKQKKYNEKNKKRVADYKKLWAKENKEHLIICRKLWVKENKEHLAKYYEDNKERILEYSKVYREKHPECKRMSEQKRKALKKKLPATLTIGQWEKIKTQFNNKCAYCGEEISLTQDHFIPLSKGGEYTHNNIIPACLSCNSKKHNKDFFSWYPQHESYSKQREQKILKFLNYKNGVQQIRMEA